MDETQKIVNEQELVSQVLSHQGWKVIERKFLDQIKKLQSIYGLKGKTAKEKIESIQINEGVVEALLAFYSDVTGTAEQFELNKDLTNKKSYLHRDE